jgi:transcriptional regulator GlxA family with amidase domain
MIVAILLYDGMTMLDAIGPYEVLASLPGVKIRFVNETGGITRPDTGALGLQASGSITDVPTADILLVPGGPGDEKVCGNQRVLDWIRTIHAQSQWTTSVCTGSLILGAAGLLTGVRATTHWMRLEKLREFGAMPTLERVVEQGKIITAAGVSSGIDMGIALARKIGGDDVAQAIQLAIEYDPQPAFNAGSPEKAPAHIVDLVRSTFESAMAERSNY